MSAKRLLKSCSYLNGPREKWSLIKWSTQINGATNWRESNNQQQYHLFYWVTSKAQPPFNYARLDTKYVLRLINTYNFILNFKLSNAPLWKVWDIQALIIHSKFKWLHCFHSESVFPCGRWKCPFNHGFMATFLLLFV